MAGNERPRPTADIYTVRRSLSEEGMIVYRLWINV
nr:MAG TPA: hypothetical protein [Caudoviricetes sp.]